MKFDKILEYQKIDQELMNLENLVAKSEERNKYVLAKNRLDSATETIKKLTKDASDLLGGYESMKNKIDTLKAEIDGFDGILEEVQDVQEAEHYLKMIAAIADKIVMLEKSANADAQKIDKINEEYNKTWQQGVKATEGFKKAKAEYDAFRAQFQPKVVELKAQLDAIRVEVPKELMDAYTALRAQKKMPAFIEYDAQKGNCGGCYMSIANDIKSKLKVAGNYAECQNCGRIMYVPE